MRRLSACRFIFNHRSRRPGGCLAERCFLHQRQRRAGLSPFRFRTPDTEERAEGSQAVFSFGYTLLLCTANRFLLPLMRCRRSCFRFTKGACCHSAPIRCAALGRGAYQAPAFYDSSRTPTAAEDFGFADERCSSLRSQPQNSCAEIQNCRRRDEHCSSARRRRYFDLSVFPFFWRRRRRRR